MGTSGPSGEHLRACFPMQVDETYLQLEFIEILLPVILAGDTWAAVRRIQAYALRTLKAPAADVQLTRTLVRQNDACRAEDVRLDVHSSPGVFEIVGEG